jgi:hypothetical protein
MINIMECCQKHDYKNHHISELLWWHNTHKIYQLQLIAHINESQCHNLTSAGASFNDMLVVVMVVPSFVITSAIPLGSTADSWMILFSACRESRRRWMVFLSTVSGEERSSK